MRTYPVLLSISDWWNYSSPVGGAVTGGSLHEHLLDGRESRAAQEVPAEIAESLLGGGPIAAEIVRTTGVSIADREPGVAAGQWWTPECFAGWNGK